MRLLLTTCQQHTLHYQVVLDPITAKEVKALPIAT